MSAVRDNNFFVVHGWMINRLGLKGNELQVYAIIYGFSQADGTEFTGNLQYLADWTNATRRTALNSLQGLVEKGLLIKEDVYNNGVKACKYRCRLDASPGENSSSGAVKNLHRGGENSSSGAVKNLHRGGEKTAPNNISHNIPDNIPDNIKDTNTPQSPQGGDVQERRFAAFWEAYPKKVGKEAARKAWKKVKPDAALHERILRAVDAAKGCDQWCREGGRYIPNPATWLNQGRWDDEPIQAYGPAGGGFQRPQQLQTSNPFLAAMQSEGVM